MTKLEQIERDLADIDAAMAKKNACTCMAEYGWLCPDCGHANHLWDERRPELIRELADATSGDCWPPIDAPHAFRFIRPLTTGEDFVEGDTALMGDLPVVVANWSNSLTDDEREEFGDHILWWAEEVRTART